MQACRQGGVLRAGGRAGRRAHPDGEQNVAANQAARSIVHALKGPALLPGEVVSVRAIHSGRGLGAGRGGSEDCSRRGEGEAEAAAGDCRPASPLIGCARRYCQILSRLQTPRYAGRLPAASLTLLAAEAVDQVVSACHWLGYGLCRRCVQGPCSGKAGRRGRRAALCGGPVVPLGGGRALAKQAGERSRPRPASTRSRHRSQDVMGPPAWEESGGRRGGTEKKKTTSGSHGRGTPFNRRDLTQADCCQQGCLQRPHGAAVAPLGGPRLTPPRLRLGSPALRKPTNAALRAPLQKQCSGKKQGGDKPPPPKK